MKSRILLIRALAVAAALTATGALVAVAANAPASPPPGEPAGVLTPAQTQVLWQKYCALRDQLLEERRLAVLAASKTSDPAARRKIFADLRIAQQTRFRQLRELHLQVRDYEKQLRWSNHQARIGSVKT